jgi:hypothetical protein
MIGVCAKPFRQLMLAICVSCFTAVLCLHDVAAAETPPAMLNTPELRALTSSPAMQKGIAAVSKGDSRSAFAHFSEAARQGNPLAQVFLARVYFEGRGVPRNYSESLRWLKPVIARGQEPTFTAALQTFKSVIDAMRNSPNPENRARANAVLLENVLSNRYVQQYLKNMANTKVLTCVGMVCM